MLSEVNDELPFTAKRAKASMVAWKAHIIGSINQDAARVDVLQSLDELFRIGESSICQGNTTKAKLIGWKMRYSLAYQSSLKKSQWPVSNADLCPYLPAM